MTTDDSSRGRRRRPAAGAPIVRRNTVRLPHDVARRVRLGHPWVYREALGTRVTVALPAFTPRISAAVEAPPLNERG